jgi:hypothetical protein
MFGRLESASLLAANSSIGSGTTAAAPLVAARPSRYCFRDCSHQDGSRPSAEITHLRPDSLHILRVRSDGHIRTRRPLNRIQNWTASTPTSNPSLIVPKRSSALADHLQLLAPSWPAVSANPPSASLWIIPHPLRGPRGALSALTSASLFLRRGARQSSPSVPFGAALFPRRYSGARPRPEPRVKAGGAAERSEGKMVTGRNGPPYCKPSKKLVLYSVAEMETWLAQRRRVSTCDPRSRGVSTYGPGSRLDCSAVLGCCWPDRVDLSLCRTRSKRCSSC